MAQEDAKALAGENPIADLSDARLVAARGVVLWGAIETEMMRRLKDSLNAGNKSATTLTKRLERLNFWLLWFPIAIFTLTVVLTAGGPRRREVPPMIAAIYAWLRRQPTELRKEDA